MYHRIKSLLHGFENSQFLSCSILIHCFKIAVTLGMETVIYMTFNYSFCDCGDVNLKKQLYNREEFDSCH